MMDYAKELAHYAFCAGLNRTKFEDSGLSNSEYMKLLDDIVASVPRPEPFGYFKAEAFCWTDCAETDDGAKPLWEAPVSAEPDARLWDVVRLAVDRLEKGDSTHAKHILLCAIAAAEQAKPAPEYCDWTPDSDQENMPNTFHGTCGIVWSLIEEGPTDNGMKFCPECGKPLRELRGEGK